MNTPKRAYGRMMLKLSGEVFAGERDYGISKPTLDDIAEQIIDVSKLGTEIVIVVGGGNIWRYRDTKDTDIERTVSDAMGMLATIMNSVALQSSLEAHGAETRVLSSIDIPQMAEPFIRRRAIRHLEKKRIIICAGGTGNPYFTTDSAAALRSLELSCNVLLKATNVDGVYDKDPRKHKDAKMYAEITYQEAIEKHLGVMDQAAFSLCQEQKLPIVVFNFLEHGSLLKVARGEKIGTVVHA
ncbi:MAG: UMP kinase [Candidatus Peribacteraceae bacterium]|nr:UMP kinase [Candidatus Peribacteraceae bacterium]